MTKVFQNCSLKSPTKAQHLFLAMFCFCSVLVVITTSNLMAQTAMLCCFSRSLCMYLMSTWLSFHIHIHIPFSPLLQATLDLFCLLLCLANMLCSFCGGCQLDFSLFLVLKMGLHLLSGPIFSISPFIGIWDFVMPDCR